mmetsp:Transcript_4503/g.14959  ORF Transcript_4503/g.14959 Transcript_4503/m.14959 type:complete len:223 (-) Transcript_4503:250-918(-)
MRSRTSSARAAGARRRTPVSRRANLWTPSGERASRAFQSTTSRATARPAPPQDQSPGRPPRRRPGPGSRPRTWPPWPRSSAPCASRSSGRSSPTATSAGRASSTRTTSWHASRPPSPPSASSARPGPCARGPSRSSPRRRRGRSSRMGGPPSWWTCTPSGAAPASSWARSSPRRRRGWGPPHAWPRWTLTGRRRCPRSCGCRAFPRCSSSGTARWRTARKGP